MKPRKLVEAVVDDSHSAKEILAMTAAHKIMSATLCLPLVCSPASGKGALVNLPKTGQVFEPRDGAKLGQWTYEGGGTYGPKGLTCCFDYFSQRNYTLLVLSSRDNDGQDRETVRSAFTIQMGERDLDTADCEMNGLDVIYAVWRRSANIVVVYYITEGRIASVRMPWKKAELHCGGFTPDE